MITVVLVKPQNPGNIGSVARAMANFSLENLTIAGPDCNPLDEKALCLSKHSKNILVNAKIIEIRSLKKYLKGFDLVAGTTSVMGTDYNIPRTPLMPDAFAKKLNLKTNAAIVFGNEGTGLSNKEIGLCGFLITIPTSKSYPAMNLSHAAAIIFYELFRVRKIPYGKKISSHILPISLKEKEVILKKLDNIIGSMHFSTAEKKETQKKAWKSIIEKSMMSKREAFAIMGLLAKLEKKISNS